jgi:hypothetical protein
MPHPKGAAFLWLSHVATPAEPFYPISHWAEFNYPDEDEDDSDEELRISAV